MRVGWFARGAVLVAFFAAAAPQILRAEPVAEAERIPVDLRRTTLVVRDIEQSLPLYRDALGLTVIYDAEIGGGVNPDGTAKAATVRLVLLRGNDTFIGALGLMQRLDIEPPAPPVFERAMPGDSILVFNAADLESRFAQLKQTPGVRIHTEPERIDYPGKDGKVIPVLFSALFDPDGNFIEVNKLLGTAAGTKPDDANHTNEK